MPRPARHARTKTTGRTCAPALLDLTANRREVALNTSKKGSYMPSANGLVATRWIGGASGAFNVAANWSGGKVPNDSGGADYAATIGATAEGAAQDDVTSSVNDV